MGIQSPILPALQLTIFDNQPLGVNFLLLRT